MGYLSGRGPSRTKCGIQTGYYPRGPVASTAKIEEWLGLPRIAVILCEVEVGEGVGSFDGDIEVSGGEVAEASFDGVTPSEV